MKTYIFYIFILLFSLNVFSQHGDKERIKAQKIAFLTNRLDLSPSEAQKFWPLYNDFDEKTMKIRHEEMRKIRMDIKHNIDNLSKEQANALLDKMMNAETTLHELNVSFVNKLKDIIPPQKIILLKIAEKEFHKKLLEQFKKRHHPDRP